MSIAKERILYEDQVLLAVSKLGGELVVKGKGRQDKLPLLDFLKKDYPSLVAVHRLDFETSGVVVFSKSRKILKGIVENKFAGWRKKYVAIVLGCPKPNGKIEFPLPARSGDGVVDALTEYKILERLGDCTLVECIIERGQRHQIRRHLSMIGHPLVLDSVYGNEKANRLFNKFLKMKRFFLHASAVDFLHPVSGAPIHIESPRPVSFDAVCKKLKEGRKNS